MSVQVQYSLELRVFNVTSLEELEHEVSAIMTTLVDLSGPSKPIDDPAISLAARSDVPYLLVEVVARGVSFDDASRVADAAIRSAIHAAGGRTPAWTFEPTGQKSDLVDA